MCRAHRVDVLKYVQDDFVGNIFEGSIRPSKVCGFPSFAPFAPSTSWEAYFPCHSQSGNGPALRDWHVGIIGEIIDELTATKVQNPNRMPGQVK
jgi:hypothetical protein